MPLRHNIRSRTVVVAKIRPILKVYRTNQTSLKRLKKNQRTPVLTGTNQTKSLMTFKTTQFIKHSKTSTCRGSWRVSNRGLLTRRPSRSRKRIIISIYWTSVMDPIQTRKNSRHRQAEMWIAHTLQVQVQRKQHLVKQFTITELIINSSWRNRKIEQVVN